jgi:dihydroorotate dehydrogenase
MGFNNSGSAAAADMLIRHPRPAYTMLGINIGKTKAVPEADAVADYVESTRRLAPHADYLVVNVSSPNTPGLRNLQATVVLRPLLTAVAEAGAELAPSGARPPLLVKIAPDLTDDEVDDIARLALELKLDGIIATNTTIERSGLRSSPELIEAAGVGGLSGAPLRERSLQVLRRLRAVVGDRLVLVSVGGIETADDAWERICAGATLVQGYTGLIYGGPLWPRRVNKGLLARLKAAGYPSIEAARGRDTAPLA